jgi:hypothetical protein
MGDEVSSARYVLAHRILSPHNSRDQEGREINFFYFSEVRRTNKSVFESRDYPTHNSLPCGMGSECHKEYMVS